MLMSNIAVIFPGVGYHADKPLLYYSKKLAADAGCELIEVAYSHFPMVDKKSAASMNAAFTLARAQAEDALRDIDFAKYGKVLFLAKSIGTIAAADYATAHGLKADFVFYTPLAQTFRFPAQNAVAFHGTADPWADTPTVKGLCEERNVPLHLYAGANHSLETGNVPADLEALRDVMRKTEDFIKGVTCG